MDWLSAIGTIIASLIALFPLAFVAYINIGGIIHAVKQASRGKTHSLAGISQLNCSVDADCPVGYVCFDGRCVAEES